MSLMMSSWRIFPRPRYGLFQPPHPRRVHDIDCPTSVTARQLPLLVGGGVGSDVATVCRWSLPARRATT